MSRVVHYASAGSHRRFFECYRTDLKAYLNKQQPHPVSRTDVALVTCPHCLFMLRLLLDRQTSQHGKRSTP